MPSLVTRAPDTRPAGRADSGADLCSTLVGCASLRYVIVADGERHACRPLPGHHTSANELPSRSGSEPRTFIPTFTSSPFLSLLCPFRFPFSFPRDFQDTFTTLLNESACISVSVSGFGRCRAPPRLLSGLRTRREPTTTMHQQDMRSQRIIASIAATVIALACGSNVSCSAP